MAWLCKLPVSWIMLFMCVLVLLSFQAHQASAEFKFLVTPLMFYAVPFGSNFNINCTTNDQNATTELYHRQSVGSNNWNLLSPRPGKIVKSGHVYTILDFGISDAGQYQCRATNALGATIRWSDKRANLIPNPNLTPPVTIDPAHAVVLTTGQSYNITCSSVSSSTLQWFKKMKDGSQTVVPSDQTYSEQDSDLNNLKVVLMFKNAQTSEAGVYVCQMTYNSRTDYKYSTLEVYAHELPKILSSSSNPLMTKHSNQTTLHCVAYGHPRPDVYWYKDGKQIKIQDCELSSFIRVCQDRKYKLTSKPVTKHTKINGSLTIFDTNFPSDQGKYICTAVNTQGKVNKTINVDVQIQPVLVLRKDPFFQVKNEPSEVECKTQKSNPAASFSWQYQGCVTSQVDCSPTPDAWKPLLSSLPPRGTTTNHSRVKIPKDQEGAFYKCTATNKYGTDSLVLTFRRIDQGRKLVDIKYPAKPPVLIAGEPVRIGCVAMSQGAMFDGGIEWYRGKNPISPRTDARVNVTNVKFDDTYTNVIITIINTTSNDSGLYTCDANFLRPRTIYNDTIMVTVKARVRPTITGLVSQEVTEKSPGYVEFLCEATTATPKATINWNRKQGGEWKRLKKIASGLSSTRECKTRTPGFYVIRNDNSHLVICNPKHERHTGWYQCTAENSEGRDEKEARLNVLAPPNLSIPKHREIKVGLGISINETCSATGNPLPDVVWIRTDDPNKEVLASGKGKALLVVKDVKEKDLGNYTCNATNTVMSVTALLTIKEERDPDVLGVKGQMSTEVLIGIICGCIIFVLIVSIICCIVYRRQKKQIDEYKELYFLRTGSSDYKIDPDRSLLEQCSNLPYDLDWEFPEERLILGKPLGSGAFGQVLKAEAIGMPAFKPRDKTPDGLKRRSKLRRSMRESKKKTEYSSMRTTKQTVAVKSLKEGATQSDYKDLASELKILIHLGEHKNIVNVLGACTRGRRLLVIIEYAPHGDLLSFLRTKRDIYDPNWVKTSNNPEQEFTLVDLAMTAYQISRGMEFLASRKCVHRDLAARNVLVGENYVMKISDFGLARDIYQDDLYVKTTSGLLPVKWMALESLFDRVYTEKSDVWSFGIVLWETFTLGGTPYPGLPTEQLLDYLSEGNRMKQPQDCPLEMYAIMRDCWIEAPDQRPNFVAIAERLGKILEKNVTTDNPYIQLEVDEDSGATNYYLNPCDSNMRSRRTVDGYEEALPTPLPQSSTSYNSPLPTIPPSQPESPGYEMANSPLPSIPPTYEEATQKAHANPEFRHVSESSNESGIGIEEKDKDREAEENEPLLVQLGYDEPAFSPSKKDKKEKRNVESSV